MISGCGTMIGEIPSIFTDVYRKGGRRSVATPSQVVTYVHNRLPNLLMVDKGTSGLGFDSITSSEGMSPTS